MTEPPYLSEYQAGYIYKPGNDGVVNVSRKAKVVGHLRNGCFYPDDKEDLTNVVVADTTAAIRKFDTGASRDTDDGKLDFEGFLSPQVLLEFAEYMHQHRLMKDGSVRDSDNWQKGMPRDVLMKSLARHFFDLWLMHRLGTDEITRPGGEVVTRRETYGGVLFNLSGLWLDTIKSEER